MAKGEGIAQRLTALYSNRFARLTCWLGCASRTERLCYCYPPVEFAERIRRQVLWRNERQTRRRTPSRAGRGIRRPRPTTGVCPPRKKAGWLQGTPLNGRTAQATRERSRRCAKCLARRD